MLIIAEANTSGNAKAGFQ